ncbi:MAG: TadE family type IV pilus minor pilin [bacterium]
MARAARGPRAGDRGSVLLEVALAIPALVAVAVALTWVVSLGATYIRALDVAQSAARQAARGGAPAPAPEGFDTQWSIDGSLVRARVTSDVSAPVPLLRGITVTVEAEAVAAAEWGLGGGGFA